MNYTRFSLHLVLLLLLPAWSAMAQPKIKAVPGSVFDLGDILQGQKAERTITIMNGGTDTLQILEVKASCGCTATLLSKRSIGPSDSSKLAIHFNTEGQNGRVTKQVYVSSNDSTTPKLTVQFTANVIQVLSFNPQVFMFMDMKQDSTYTRTITVQNPSRNRSVKILNIDPKLVDLTVTMEKKELGPGDQTQMQAVFTPKKPGSYAGIIEIMTDNPEQPKATVKVNTWVNRK